MRNWRVPNSGVRGSVDGRGTGTGRGTVVARDSQGVGQESLRLASEDKELESQDGSGGRSGRVRGKVG